MFNLPLSFVAACVVVLIGMIAFVIALSTPTRTDEDRRLRRLSLVGVAIGTAVLGGLLLLSASATMVPARHVAVPVTLGHPGPSFGEGFAWVKPWTRVEKFDATTQTLVMDGDGKDKDAPHVTVRLGNETTADVDVRRLAWNLNPHGDIVELYRRYRSFDKVEPNLIQGEAANALVTVLSTFDPLAGINGGDSGKPKSVADLQVEVQKTLQTAIDAKVGTGAVVVEAPLMFVNYDGTTQQKLNDYAKALAETRIAQQAKQTAIATREANAELAKGATAVNTPAVLYQQCLGLVRDLAGRDQLGKLPPTFSCQAPGTTGSGSSVLVQGGAR